MKRTKHFKRLLGVGVAAGLATVSLSVFGSAADATVNVGAINCTSTTILGPIAIRNPSISHVTGPVWAATGTAATITNKGGKTILPRNVGVATIGGFEGIVNKSQIVGSATTTVATGPVPGLVFQYDPDLADNGGVPDPVPMDGVAMYGAMGPFPAPTVIVSGPLPLVGTAGTYDITTTLDPGAGALPTGTTPGNPGGLIVSPDVPLSITNTGTTDGQINVVATSTALTANVTAPLPTQAVTTCAPSANPVHTVNVQTDNAAITAAHPVIACDPANNTPGLFKDSKGWFSQDTDVATAENYGGSLGGATTYDGCVAPDVRLNDWVLSKNGALPADSLALAKAAIAVKAKSFGNCTLVDVVSPTGGVHNANSSSAYQSQGTVAAKWLTAANATSKVKGSTIYGAIRLVVDTTGAGATALRFEANGIVTKGTGLGGAAKFVGEVDTSQAPAQNIIACNSPGYVAPAVGSFFAKAAPYLNLKTGDDAVLQILAP